MTASMIFSAANVLALVSWIVLIFAVFRRNDWLRDVLLGRFVPLAFATLYLLLIVFFFAKAPGSFDSLSNVKLLFTSDWMVLAGWVHYLAFDLFLGCWIAREAAASGMPRWPMLVILPLTFLFGPIGYLSFEVTRFLLTHTSEVSA